MNRKNRSKNKNKSKNNLNIKNMGENTVKNIEMVENLRSEYINTIDLQSSYNKEIEKKEFEMIDNINDLIETTDNEIPKEDNNHIESISIQEEQTEDEEINNNQMKEDINNDTMDELNNNQMKEDEVNDNTIDEDDEVNNKVDEVNDNTMNEDDKVNGNVMRDDEGNKKAHEIIDLINSRNNNSSQIKSNEIKENMKSKDVTISEVNPENYLLNDQGNKEESSKSEIKDLKPFLKQNLKNSKESKLSSSNKYKVTDLTSNEVLSITFKTAPKNQSTQDKLNDSIPKDMEDLEAELIELAKNEKSIDPIGTVEIKYQEEKEEKPKETWFNKIMNFMCCKTSSSN